MFSRLFGNERSSRVDVEEMKNMILSTLETLHISCAFNCLQTVKSMEDFVGICVFHKDGKKLLEDNGHRIKSGYIFVSKPTDLQIPGDTLHRQAYKMLFKNIEHFNGVTIVGFSQENKQLKGRSGTFNQAIMTNLWHRDEKDCLFIFRTLIFGAIIMHKLSQSRNISPYSASLCICLFLIIKNQGDREQLDKFPVSDLDLQDREVFTQEMFISLGVSSRIIDVACNYHHYTRFTRWFRVELAMKILLQELHDHTSAADFEKFLDGLLDVYPPTDIFGRILRAILRALGLLLW